jgi:hypothetical protein
MPDTRMVYPVSGNMKKVFQYKDRLGPSRNGLNPHKRSIGPLEFNLDRKSSRIIDNTQAKTAVIKVHYV